MIIFNRKIAALLSALLFLALPARAHAMHIADGVISLPWAGLWYVLSAPFIAAGLVRLKKSAREGKNIKPLLGLVGAAVFVMSCMPVPVPTAGTSSHITGTALAAVVAGPLYAALVSASALLLQALLLSDGGLTTWGANIFSMGVAGSFAGYFIYKGLARLGAPVSAAAFMAGMLGDWSVYAVTSAQLALALHGPGEFMRLFLTVLAGFAPTQVPLGILEGIVTAVAVKFLHARRPELFCAPYPE